MKNTEISEKIGTYWDCLNLCVDVEVRDFARLTQLLAGEQCNFCGETLTEQKAEG